jgi:hypothetical protein
VFALCETCSRELGRLFPSQTAQRLAATIERAVSNPTDYFCCIFADPGAARLAAALLAHPKHSGAALDALGWLSTD